MIIEVLLFITRIIIATSEQPLYETKCLLCYNVIVLFGIQTKLAADFKMHKLNGWFVTYL